MVVRVVDACRLRDESDSEPSFAHQTSLILSDTRWLRIAGPTATESERRAYRLQAGFRELWPEFDAQCDPGPWRETDIS